jgi:hypothetical protein
MRALENSARNKGATFLLNYHMDVIYREKVLSGKVLGIQAHYTPTILSDGSLLQSYRSDGNLVRNTETVTIKANKAVFIGTGGNMGNIEFRRIFDPRLTEEYPVLGHEYSPKDASGELAAMAIGATLWGTTNQVDRYHNTRRWPYIGTLANFIGYTPESPIFPRVKGSGLQVRDWHDCIIVNQVGKRFYNELDDGAPRGTTEGFYDSFGGYVQGDWRNQTRIKYQAFGYVDAALAMNEGSSSLPDYSAGPQWAIFDSDGVTRERWDLKPTSADPNLFFQANTLAELADKINSCTFQRYKMSGKTLEETVQRFNSLVDRGTDEDFGRPGALYKIANAPFYAGWASVSAHDSYAGLRINGKSQVIDLKGQVIPGLYCGGESAGGCGQHGLARTFVQGYIAGYEALRA